MAKKILASLLSAMVGGCLVVFGIWYFQILPNGKVRVEHIPVMNSKNVRFNALKNADKAVLVDFSEIAEQTMPAVVHIKSSQTVEQSPTAQWDYDQLPSPFRFFFENRDHPQFKQERRREPNVRMGSGSGVIINAEGYIITNNHVIEGASEIEVVLNDNRTYKAQVIGTDPSTDLALIKIDETGLSTLPFVDSDNVKVGEWVLALGNPFNLNSTVTAGIVSAKGRSINILTDKYAVESFIQTDAAINPGNSGGALVNVNGELVGINTAISSPTGTYAGYGFAVPSNIVNKVVEDLLKYGTVQRGYLGVMIRGINGAIAKEKGLKVNEGVYVDSLVENSSAGEAGIKNGDVIYEVDGVVVKSAPELQETIARHRPGDKLTIKVDRFGKEKSFDVVLKGSDGEREVAAAERSEVNSILGADFEEVDKGVLKKLGIDGGVKVNRLYPGKLRQYTDMKEGFIITKVDGEVVKSLKDFTKIMKDKKGGGVMLEGKYEDYPGTKYYAFGMDS